MKRKLYAASVSAMVLALVGCGGGGGGGVAGTTAANTTNMNITPVKGKFSGSCSVSVKNVTSGTVFVNKNVLPVNASGVIAASLPNTATGPYLVTLDGTGGGCRYYDETNGTTKTLATVENLNVLLPSMYNVASGVAVTALTDIAFNYASATASGGTLTDALALQGAVYAWNALNLPAASAVTDMFAPPRTSQIPQSGVAAPTDDVPRVLYNLARTSHNAPMSAVKAMALQAQINATSIATGAPAANGQTLQAQLNSLTASMSAVAGAQAISGVLAQAASAAIAAGNAGVAATFVAEMQGGGLQEFDAGMVSGVMTSPAVSYTLTANSNNGLLYTITRSMRQLVNGAWQAMMDSGMWVLGAKGWVDRELAPASAQLNADGTISYTLDGYGTYQAMVAQMPAAMYYAGIPALNANGQRTNFFASGVAASGVFTASDVAYQLQLPNAGGMMWMPVSAVQDTYFLSTTITPGLPINLNGLYTISGVPLTALPNATTAFCAQGSYYAPNPASSIAGIQAYDVYGMGFMGMGFASAPTATAPCTPASGIPMTAAFFQSKTVNTVAMLDSAISGVGGSFIAQTTPTAPVLMGYVTPAGGFTTQPPLTQWNMFPVYTKRATMNKLMTAHGLPVIP